MTTLGQISLWLALLVAAWGTVTGVLGAQRGVELVDLRGANAGAEAD